MVIANPESTYETVLKQEESKSKKLTESTAGSSKELVESKPDPDSHSSTLPNAEKALAHTFSGGNFANCTINISFK